MTQFPSRNIPETARQDLEGGHRSTVPERVLAHAAARPDTTCYLFHNPTGAPHVLSFSELVNQAMRVAGAVRAAGCAHGDRVALIFDHGPSFVIALFGLFFSGCAAVPIAPPSHDGKRLRASAILEEAACTALLTTSALAKTFAGGEGRIDGVPLVISIDELDEARQGLPVRADTADVAIVQYTSGSTGQPRGVVVTHGALHAQMLAIDRSLLTEGEERVVTWLPPEHDMGLVGGLLFNVWRGNPSYVLAPESFIRRPILWLDTISRWRATISVAPNFAYDLCVRTISPEKAAKLDLSCWKVAMNGAEPLRPETLVRFARAFEPAGFDPRAFLPCYGLAEATLLVTGASRGTGARTRWFDQDAIEAGRVVPVDTGTGRCLVSSGMARTTGGVRIVETGTGIPSAADRVGEIWIAGESLGSCYHGRPEDSEATFGQFIGPGDGPYLRSGDTGFIWEDELYVTGRLKDIVLWHGRTLHAADLELLLAGVDPAIRPGRIAAQQRDDGAVDLVVEIAPGRCKADGGASVAERIWRDLMANAGVDAARIRLARPGTLTWTSSGKLRRRDSHARLDANLDLLVLDWEPGTLRARQAQCDAAQILAAEIARSMASSNAYLRFLTAWVAAGIGCSADEIDPDVPWADQGMDSLMTTELVVDLEGATGYEIPPEVLFEIPTPASLARALSKGLP